MAAWKAALGQQEAPGPGLSDSRSMELYHALPIVDIAAYTGPGDASSRKHVAAQWDAALSDVGFVIITGTGVPKVLLDSCRAQAAAFFASSHEEKMRFNHGYYGHPRGGYTPFGVETVALSNDGTPPAQPNNVASSDSYRKPVDIIACRAP